jgi:hypothetical protein
MQVWRVLSKPCDARVMITYRYQTEETEATHPGGVYAGGSLD